MAAIHTFDKALREEFEQHGHNAGVVFLRTDPQGQVIPCSPNKILLSTVTTVRPGSRFLPVGFATNAKVRTVPHVRAIDDIVGRNSNDCDDPFVIDVQTAEEIVDHIGGTLVMDDGSDWDTNAFKAILRHLVRANSNPSQSGQVTCLVRRDRDLAKVRPSGRLQSAPDSMVERQAMEQFQGDRPARSCIVKMGKVKVVGRIVNSGGRFCERRVQLAQ